MALALGQGPGRRYPAGPGPRTYRSNVAKVCGQGARAPNAARDLHHRDRAA